MGSYTNYDFSETVNHYDSPINEKQVEKVLFAFGDSQEGYGEWSGGFIMLLKDGRVVMMTGWCDTSGWGCQDGIEFTELGSGVEDWADKIRKMNKNQWHHVPSLEKWDMDPVDLNRYLRGEIGRW